MSFGVPQRGGAAAKDALAWRARGTSNGGAVRMAVTLGGASDTADDADRGLKKGALSFASNVVIGVASTAPAYSLAAALPALVAAAKFGVPAILILAFVPM